MDTLSEKQRLEETRKETKLLFKDDYTGHDVDHSFRVFENAKKLRSYPYEKKPDGFIVALASLMHDWDDRKLFTRNYPYEHAIEFRKKRGVSAYGQNRIVSIISHVSYGERSTEPLPLEAQIVQDADRLDAIGAIGIARAFQFGGSHQRKLYDSEEVIHLHPSKEEYRNNTLSTIAHFYQKLLQIKEKRNTEAGKKEAEKREAFRLSFLKEFQEEINAPLYKKLY